MSARTSRQPGFAAARPAILLLLAAAALPPGCASTSPGDGPPAKDGSRDASGRDAAIDADLPAPPRDAAAADGPGADADGGAAPDAGPPALADEFACLQGLASVKLVAQDLITGQTTLADGTPVPDTELWFTPTSGIAIPPASGIDVRGATLVVPTLGWSSGNEYRKWYPFTVRGGLSDICIAGGDFLGTLPLDIGWHDSKGSAPNAIGDNSAPVHFSGAGHTVTGVYAFNNHDSVRPTTLDGAVAADWTLAHSWIAYNRDDCIENDAAVGSGLIHDTLFDGCYVAYSARTTSPQDRTGDVITFDKVLLRMEPMPFPYRWWDRNLDRHLYIAPYTTPVDNAGYTSSSGIPFGHGLLFKLNQEPSANPRFALKDSVLLLQQRLPSFNQLPPDDLIASCKNITVVWAGNAPLADFIASFEVPAKCKGELTITDDRTRWERAVGDWHARHPHVGQGHKPAVSGSLAIPRWDPQPWPY